MLHLVAVDDGLLEDSELDSAQKAGGDVCSLTGSRVGPSDPGIGRLQAASKLSGLLRPLLGAPTRALGSSLARGVVPPPRREEPSMPRSTSLRLSLRRDQVKGAVRTVERRQARGPLATIADYNLDWANW